MSCASMTFFNSAQEVQDNLKILWKNFSPMGAILYRRYVQLKNGIIDFYITSNPGGKSNPKREHYVKYYEDTFVKNYESSSWFVLRKAFESDDIAKSFVEKQKNMDTLLKAAEEIHEKFNLKCSSRNDCK